MATAYLIRHDDDAAFVEREVLPSLSILGFDLKSDRLGSTGRRIYDVALVVVSQPAGESKTCLGDVVTALGDRRPVVPIGCMPPRSADSRQASPALRRCTCVTDAEAPAAEEQQLWSQLKALLQPIAQAAIAKRERKSRKPMLAPAPQPWKSRCSRHCWRTASRPTTSLAARNWSPASRMPR